MNNSTWTIFEIQYSIAKELQKYEMKVRLQFYVQIITVTGNKREGSWLKY